MCANATLRPSFAMAALVIVFLTLYMAGIVTFPGQASPKANWQFSAAETQVMPTDQVPVYDPMTLALDLPFPAYVYAVSFDLTNGAISLFPSDYLASNSQNPLPKGQHLLPGSLTDPENKKDEQQNWFVLEGAESLNLMVVVSREPLNDLRAAMANLRQMGNTAFADHSMGLYMPRKTEANRKGRPPARSHVPHKLIQQAMYDEKAADPQRMLAYEELPEVWIHGMLIRPSKPRPGVKRPNQPILQKLEGALQEKLQEQDQ